MNFCSNCGSAQINLRVPEGDNRPRFVCGDCAQIFYENPKIVVGCLPFYQDKLLLCKRAIEPRAQFWNLPAGFMENGETVEQGAKREVLEEAEAQVELIRLHAVYSIKPVNQVYMLFLARLTHPHFAAGDETLDARLFAPDEIPYEQLAFTSNHFAITRYFAAPQFEGVHVGGYYKDAFPR